MKTIVQVTVLGLALLLVSLFALCFSLLTGESTTEIAQAQTLSNEPALISVPLEKKKQEFRGINPQFKEDPAESVAEPILDYTPNPKIAKKELTLEQLEAIAMQPAKEYKETGSRVVPEMLPLFREMSIQYTGKDKYTNTKLRFRLHTPENMEPGKKYPLILWLHGVGERGDDNQAQLIHLHHIITYLTGPNKKDFFLLVPQTPNDHSAWDAYTGYTYTKLQQVIGPDGKRKLEPIVQETDSEPFEDSPLGFSFAMVDSVVEQFPVDKNRITVSGLSSGGDGTWRALERRPELFAGAVPLVSWRALKEDAIKKHPILKEIPIWAIYSSDDNGIEQARKDFARVEDAGCNVKKSEFGVCGHNAWTPAMLQADIFSWLLSRAKKDGEYVSVSDANVNPDDMTGVVEVALRAPGKPTLAATPIERKDKPTISVEPMQTMTTISAPVAVPTPPAGVASVPMVGRPIAQMSRPLVDVAPLAPGTVIDHANRPFPAPVPCSEELRESKDRAYIQLANRYLQTKDIKGFERVLGKVSPANRVAAISRILMQSIDTITLQTIENILDRLSDQPTAQTSGPVTVDGQAIPFVQPRIIIQEEEEEYLTGIPAEPAVVEQAETKAKADREAAVAASSDIPGAKIVEDCDRPWAMTSESLYGMFPADWDREAKKIPDFIVKSTTEELSKTLLDSLKGNRRQFKEACQSILDLENKPMSSPWFETSGGRLRSDIKYTLSAKGRMFVNLLVTVEKNPGGLKSRDDLKQIDKTLQKIRLILGEKYR